MKLYDLLSALETFSCTMPRDMQIHGIASDSRRVEKGDLFVCIRGLREDGHDYLRAAISAGAVAVVTEEGRGEIPEGPVHITVPDTRAALARLYHAWYGYPGDRLRLIAVTGTNGKTSVSFMLRALWEASLEPCGLIGTVACDSGGRRLQSSSVESLANMTTPDPQDLYRLLAEMARDGVRTVIMETTSHALALGKLDALHFDAAIFTNLTPEHLDFHKTMDAYAAAKAGLFQKTKLGIFNADSPYSEQMMTNATCRCITCTAKDKDADYSATEIETQAQNGVAYRLSSKRTRLRIVCPIAGEFTVMNSMQAAICALALGCSPAAIKTALATMGGIKGRMERVRLGLKADFSVLIDYAHTPDALEKLLLTARDLVQKGGRTVVLFGCGGDRDRTKRAVMGEIAARLADHVIITSDNSRGEDPMEIICQIVSGIPPQKAYTVIPDRAAAIRYAIENAKAGDLILLAGKGHEQYEIVGGERRPFCEGCLVKEAFAARLRAQKVEDEKEGEPTV